MVCPKVSVGFCVAGAIEGVAGPEAANNATVGAYGMRQSAFDLFLL